ncbi:MAG TPA: tRNA (adenosine(37)-N6)-threonylcarbamoyltransferase complex dimerization subunit type 1 TsaB [Chromatiaceae bacterium]|jgi:tRNA threonylcarbamoyladenosine biosynthesis protein TsaB|nr:tRNA (adenosine(37)-N6)-threonylcarbamoyltransferase complex dimerization subunit type 1 TsaB [Chromatiaceae bacterium]HIA08139.1 tRNA (adenosine(37)-N6)-threonylcarbamoyltransferase complex dimerization subunit type 1 TsaB [Chromatiaceae bacterium]HIN82667.1 tRNA (adenosine(37)-N6)-threonylcarbamoyltransferase complex dimerization subunit type 1 TsaB [Chromatiales bacterium]HIO14487.1 tRNA (adenosine(37)-N6)-threonylcarbamoyltransferase complex dimerization subunit type 1 TsaB [Chromatiales 
MRNLLAIETATEACSAALWVDGKIIERYEIAPRQHARRILDMIDEVLAEAGVVKSQLDAIAFGRGPGAFTGLRIAAGVAQGIAFGLDLPVAPVSTLAALAQSVDHGRYSQVLAVLDARMQQVYAGAYGVGDDGLVELQGTETVVDAEDMDLPEGDSWFGVGSGWKEYGLVIQERMNSRLAGFDADRFPRAESIARLGAKMLAAGQGVAPEQALPVYLRDQVADRSAKV